MSLTSTHSSTEVVNTISEWSGMRLSISKCRLTDNIYELQALKRKKYRDCALQTRLANIRVGRTPISIISQDDPLPRGYLGTALTASLSPKSHLKWTIDTISTISKAVLAAPLPPGIQQRLLLYGPNSKIMHTYCLMAPSPIKTIDSNLEATCRQIWKLPKGFPRANLHAPHDELGPNLPFFERTTAPHPSIHGHTSSMTKEPSGPQHAPP